MQVCKAPSLPHSLPDSLPHTALVFAHLARWPRQYWKWLLGCSQTGLLDIRRRHCLPVGLFQSADDTGLESRWRNVTKKTNTHISRGISWLTPLTHTLESRRTYWQLPPPLAPSHWFKISKLLGHLRLEEMSKLTVKTVCTLTDLYCNSIWEYNLCKCVCVWGVLWL